ncbi:MULTISPECIES: hypothetical protein [Enterococcus]|uniref:hypothetical protein n=1 Tax=Enterococcus TaxID=1350 RepID=UPI000989A3A7|nr:MULTISPECIES: hypothetical protein [Enterococcus]MDN3048468.1 hypothetical protein [Enterococcus faecium]SJX69666.1 hypothetical protein FM130_06020 [Enterococcus faecium]
MSMEDDYLKNKKYFEMKKIQNQIKALHFKEKAYSSQKKVVKQNSRVEERLNRFIPGRNK